MSSIASFDPRPQANPRPASSKKVFKNQKWVDLEPPQLCPTVPESPDALPAFIATQHSPGDAGVDYRPHIFDKASKKFCLLDSGSQVTAWPPDPGDVVDPTIRLKAVNGSRIDCYGYKDIYIKLNRKSYKFRAVKANIDSPVIGWDFIRFHRWNFIWNEFGDIMVNDKKAKISQVLHFKAIPADQSLGVKKLSVVSDISHQGLSGQDALDHIAQLAAVQALAPQAPAVVPPPPQVQSLLDKYPEILVENFNTNEVKNGVLHKINLKPDYTPFRAKVRRLLPGSPKEVLAKKAWFQLLDMGIIEKVDKSTSNVLSSPVHFVPKVDGTLRPTGDFRALNIRTELDVFPLPHLRDFTHKIRGCKYFSKVDLMKSFHQIVIDPKDRFKTTVTTPWGMLDGHLDGQ